MFEKNLNTFNFKVTNENELCVVDVLARFLIEEYDFTKVDERKMRFYRGQYDFLDTKDRGGGRNSNQMTLM